MSEATIKESREARGGGPDTQGPSPLSPGNFIFRLLTFRLSRSQFAELSGRHILVGLIGTWLVGMGRYWDDPEAHWLQHLGVGSLVYVLSLSVLLWVIFGPLRPERCWTYRGVLGFVSLTSFPAVLYAIPVEKFLSTDVAADMNLVFLLIVAAWRVLLLLFFLRRYALLSWPRTLAGTGFPLFSALTLLAVQRLLGDVVNVMGGVRQRPAFSFGDLAGPFAIATMVSFVVYVVLVAVINRPK
jgi:hypothetical protein